MSLILTALGLLYPPAHSSLDGQPKRHGGGKPKLELAGERHGVLLVIKRAERPARLSLSPGIGAWWRCTCDCGRNVIVQAARIKTVPRRCICRA